MKAAVKPMCGSREIKFYEQLQENTTDPNMELLRKLVPEFRGTVKMPFRGKMVDPFSLFLILFYINLLKKKSIKSCAKLIFSKNSLFFVYSDKFHKTS